MHTSNEDMFLKADKALSKLNFLFQLKSKTNLVTLRKCDSHLQYYKIDLVFLRFDWLETINSQNQKVRFDVIK